MWQVVAPAWFVVLSVTAGCMIAAAALLLLRPTCAALLCSIHFSPYALAADHTAVYLIISCDHSPIWLAAWLPVDYLQFWGITGAFGNALVLGVTWQVGQD